MVNINVVTNSIYYDVFLGEEFNNKDPYTPKRNSKWYEYRGKRHGVPPNKDKILPEHTISVFKNIKEIDFDIYITDRKFWVISKELYGFFEKNELLKSKIFEYSTHSIYNFKGDLLSDKFIMLRFFKDNSDSINWSESQLTPVKDKFTGVKNNYFNTLNFNTLLDFFVIHQSPFYNKSFFITDKITEELKNNFRGLDFYELNDFVDYHRNKYKY